MKACLTVSRFVDQAGTKVGFSEPSILIDKVDDQQIKDT